MIEKDFNTLKVEDLAQLISPNSKAYRELKKRGILRTKNVVGELGEYYAIEFYNSKDNLPELTQAEAGLKNVNAFSSSGEKFSIKSVTSRKGTTGSFWDPLAIQNNERQFDFLIISILDDNYLLDLLIELSWDEFMQHKRFNKRMNSYNISLTSKLIESVQIQYSRDPVDVNDE